MDAPTIAELRIRSKLLLADFPDPDGDDALTALRDDAAELVSSLTGRAIGFPPGEDNEEVPASMLNLAKRAVTLIAEQMNVDQGTTAAKRRSAIRGRNLQSFTAGPYSESYFSPQIAIQAKQLNPDPEVNEVLWALATDAKKDEWMFFWGGERAPAAGAVAFEYENRPGYQTVWPYGSR